MKSIALEIAYHLTEALRVPPAEQADRLRQELAVRLYQKELLNFGKARELAQMSKWEFHHLLGQEKIVRHYDIEDLKEDLESLEYLEGDSEHETIFSYMGMDIFPGFLSDGIRIRK